jgi:hypothetical protein
MRTPDDASSSVQVQETIMNMTSKRIFAGTLMAAITALAAGALPMTGSEAEAQPKPCPAKTDRLGGYERYHVWCKGTYVKVLVECQKGPGHSSSYYRWGYNKAECHLGREGHITDRDAYTCSKPSGGICKG